MKRNHIFRNASLVLASLVMGAFTMGCSDWDDHYDGNAFPSAGYSCLTYGTLQV